MSDLTPDLSALPTAAWVALGVALVLQLTLMAIGLIVLIRTPVERLQFGKKWPWVLIIVLVNFIGALLFLAIGRSPAPMTEAETSSNTPLPGTIARTVHNLYGDDHA